MRRRCLEDQWKDRVFGADEMVGFVGSVVYILFLFFLQTSYVLELSFGVLVCLWPKTADTKATAHTQPF